MIQINKAFQALIPPLSAEERAQLEANLVADGCRDPLVVWLNGAPALECGTLLDGHNRYEICTRLGIHYEIVEAEGIETEDDALLWIVRNQLGRRNISDYTRAELTLVAKPIIEAKAKANQVRKPSDSVRENSHEQTRTDEVLADMAGVSSNTIRKVERIQQQAAPELIEAARRKEVSINAAADVASLPKEEQRDLVARGEKEILEAAKAIRSKKAEERRAERVARIVEISTGNRPLELADKFPVIYCDPPWRYEYAETESRAIENQYPTMELDEICALPVANIATDDCVLFMWSTSPKLADAMRVLSAWGFEYRTCAAWDKEVIGMGYYFRQQHELLLVATKGTPITPLPANRPPSVVRSRREAHSKKPEIFHELIEQMYGDLPKVEMFSRAPRPGWASWGNQSEAA
jgi:N6-adenosine-specific RNA methylase IME4